MSKLRWNKRRPACVNCGDSAADRRSNGYCALCWPSADKLRLMSTWNYSDPKTWRGCVYQNWHMWPDATPSEYCEAAKALLEDELATRKHLARQPLGKEPIDGLNVENALRNLLEL